MNNDFQNGGMPYNNDPNMMPQQPMQGGMGGPQPGYGMQGQQPMQQQPMYNQMPQQQMGGYPQQPMQQPMYGQQGGSGSSAAAKKLPVLIGAGVAGIIVFILLLSLVSTKTLTCKESDEYDGVSYKTLTKVKFKFGKIHSRYGEATFDFSDSDYDKDDIDDMVEDLEKSAKSSCKKSKGCTYSIKKSGKKISVKTTTKYKKDDKEDIDDYDDFKAYKKDFDEMCDD